VQKLSKFGHFKNQTTLTQKLQRGPIHIIHQILSTLQAFSDDEGYFLKYSKFVDISGVKVQKLSKFGNLKNQTTLTQKLQRGPMHIIHQIASTLQGLSDGVIYISKIASRRRALAPMFFFLTRNVTFQRDKRDIYRL
jgi:hypothetical protein